MRITDLNIYPLKSARGISLAESFVSPEGLPGDRRLMLVDPSGQFITQRELPDIATIIARAEQDGYQLSIDGKGQVLATPRTPASIQRSGDRWSMQPLPMTMPMQRCRPGWGGK